MLGSLLTRLHPALRLLLALSLLLALGAALLWLANRQDQALSPELLAAQTRQPPAPEDLDGQMPLILAGFDAPASPQPVAQAQALGRARLMRDIERLNWSLAHGGHIGPDGPPLLPVSHALGPDDVLPPALRCNSASQPCAANVLARRADWQAHLASPVATTLLARYAAAVQAPRQDLPWPNFPLADTPRYHIIARSAQLLLAQASLALADGQDAAALQQLDHALHLPQRLAQYSANLLTSVSALHMMNLQLHWMSELLRQHPRLCHGPPAQALRATLARAQAPMADALRGEMRGMLSAAPFSLEYARALMDPHFDPLAPPPRWHALAARAYQPQRTQNALLRHAQTLAQLAQTPAHRYDADAQTLRQSPPPDDWAWLGLRNAYGRYLLRQFSQSSRFHTYIERAHDLAGHRRLLLLQLAACAQNVSAAHMPGWLAQSPPDLRNPYTQAPMQWDAASASLVFEGRQPQRLNPGQSPIYRVTLRAPDAQRR